MELRDLVQGWIEETGRVCDGSAEALAWMEAYGTDHARAWHECRRGDYLVLMAAALGADAGVVFDVTCAFSRRCLDAVPVVVDWPRLALARAEDWRHTPPHLSRLDAQISDVILDNTEVVVRQLTRLSSYGEEGIGERLRGMVAGCLGSDLKEALTVGVERACAVVQHEHEISPTLLDLRDRYTTLQHALAVAHATSAATACLVGASISAGFVPSQVPPRKHELSSAARFSQNTLLVEAYRAALHAAAARGRHVAGLPSVWVEATFAYASGLITSVLLEGAGTPVDDPLASSAREQRATLERAFASGHEAAQAEMAEAIRAAIPFSSMVGRPRRPARPQPDAALELREVVELTLGLTTLDPSCAYVTTLTTIRDAMASRKPLGSRQLLTMLSTLRAQVPPTSARLLAAIDRSATHFAHKVLAEARGPGESLHN